MSLNAVSVVSGSEINSVGPSVPVPQVSGVAPSPAATPTSGEPAQAQSPTKPKEPFLLVPTEPLSPTVLAELIGRQLSLNGTPASG
jgi:hypothetical protein